MIKKQMLLELLEQSDRKKVLILGEKGLFDHKEISRFLKLYTLELTDLPCSDTVVIIEPPKLNPIEEMMSEEAYEMGIPSYNLVELEELISKTIDDDSLLMAIRLGNDQERIIRVLGNPHISDKLFVRLLQVYRWDEEEDDSRDDRNVILHTLRRYIDIKPNEEDLLQTYLTLRRLATEAIDPALLMALIGFHNFEFLVRGKEKVTLRETIARNRSIDSAVITKLLSLRDRRVDIALAGNPAVSLEVLKKLIQKSDNNLHKALATNPNIDNMIFKTLLACQSTTVEILLLKQHINRGRYDMVVSAELDADIIATMAANEQLDDNVQELLVKSNNILLLEYLALNDTIQSEILIVLYKKEIISIHMCLAKNYQTPKDLLLYLYLRYKNNKNMLASLAYNSSLPQSKLVELYGVDDFEINKGLATNKSLPRDLIEHLKLDHRLQNHLAENEVLIKEYEKVFDYDARAII